MYKTKKIIIRNVIEAINREIEIMTVSTKVKRIKTSHTSKYYKLDICGYINGKVV